LYHIRMTDRVPPPLIGITSHSPLAPDRAALDALLAQIVRGVERAGGAPVTIPPGVASETLRGIAAHLDGLLISGGGDIDPARYGAEWHPSIGGVDPDRDRLEIELVHRFVSDGAPLFGICRGAQVLNVALGGTLYRTVEEHPGAQRHAFYPGLPYDLRPHPVQIAEDSRLAGILGAPLVAVNSLHHQAVRDLAPGVRAVAYAPDGMVEALEVIEHSFALAVQWHPEALPDAPEMRRLFEAFVAACRKRAVQ